MSVSIVLGSQWGDEGKGKLVDILASSADLCCRAAGGHNAGHTIVVGGVSYDFHILPSGLINPRCEYNLIGSGTVVHIPSFFKELRTLEERGLEGVRDRVLISQRAHVCFDLHGYVDGLAEDRLKRTAGVGSVIGTTRRGIGPCYADKVGRHGVTLWMLVNGQDRWEKRLRDLESSARALYGDEALQHYDIEDEIRRMHEYRVEIKKYVIDSTNLLQSALGIKVDPSATEAPSPKNVLIEGANALLLDIDHGTYPYVTSSNTGLAGVFSGLAGFSHKALSRPNSAVIGVVKAYATRVGAGPFPTELGPEIAHVSKTEADYGVKLQEIGREFGVTTGRRRRCGWLDLVLLRYSMQINNYTVLNLTKLDVLDTFEEIRVAVRYKDRSTGDVHPSFPADIDQLENLEIEYKTFPGWNTKTSGTKTWDDLPQKAKEYVEYIEQQVGVPVKWIGTGPRREDMIVR